MNTEVYRDTAIQKLREVITTATTYVVLHRKNQLGTCRCVAFASVDALGDVLSGTGRALRHRWLWARSARCL